MTRLKKSELEGKKRISKAYASESRSIANAESAQDVAAFRKRQCYREEEVERRRKKINNGMKNK